MAEGPSGWQDAGSPREYSACPKAALDPICWAVKDDAQHIADQIAALASTGTAMSTPTARPGLRGLTR
jgi:hypothetical protein